MITIIACHYRLPEQRLRDFITWNDKLFTEFGVKLLIVSDVPRDNLPSYCRLEIYPAPLQVYSPAKVSNFGIRSAASGIICKTDIDCVFSKAALEEIASCRAGKGVYFCYMMAKRFEELDKAVRWGSTCGTMALHFSDWDKINGYDERLEGYGVEDGDGVARAMKVLALKQSKSAVWHVSHTGDELWTQTNICLRRDLWNRKNGFCPDRHSLNSKIRKSSPWVNPAWGTAQILVDSAPSKG
jgi:hypothetical protein